MLSERENQRSEPDLMFDHELAVFWLILLRTLLVIVLV
jgi:hypothetical protein